MDNATTEKFKLIFKLDEQKIDEAGDEHQQKAYSDQFAEDLRYLVISELFNETYDQEYGYNYQKGNLFFKIESIRIYGGQLKEKEENRRVEFLICVIHQRLKEVFASVIQDVMNSLGKHIYPELVYSLVAEKPGLFLNNYSAYDSGLALQSIKFCNILEHTRLLCHQTTKAFNQADFDRLITQNNGHRSPPTPNCDNIFKVSKTGMLAKFEHDLQLLSISFFYIRKYKKAVDLIKLEIGYSSIQQWFIHLDRKQYLILLRLKHPPVVRRTSNVITFGGAAAKQYIPPNALANNQKKIFQRNWKTHAGERCISWNDTDLNLAYDINNSPIFCMCFDALEPQRWVELIGRLQSCLKLPLEMRRFEMEDTISFKNLINLINASIRSKIHNFDLLYILDALFSRGYQFLDHLMKETARENFLSLVKEAFSMTEITTLQILEQMLLLLDEQLEFPNPANLFEKLFNEISIGMNRMWLNDRDGYILVRKIMITPSRVLLLAPEMLMSNRVLRYDQVKYPANSFIRVIFRDDDFGKVHPSKVTHKLLKQFIGDNLKAGICIAGGAFNFIGASNSQLRDGGCYFLRDTIDNINEFRQQLGSFSTTSVPKMMSRLGQCFTQALESSVDMTYQVTVKDFIGGSDRNGKPYIFSDGCGSISRRASVQIAKDLGLDFPPSCVQIRCGGLKGVNSLDVYLDNWNQWLEENKNSLVNTLSEKGPIDIVFRESQHKFGTNEDAVNKLEIVKYSSPVLVCLNKPLINILDQVSRLQSFESHTRITNRVKTLLEKHMFELCETLTNNEAAISKLCEFSKLIDYSKLNCFNLTEEPFFKLILRASAKTSIYKLRQKSHIQVPASCGRVMFGIVDTTETLQSGQVFVQYTNNVNNKNPSDKSCKTVLTSQIMITKNPCIVAGDVRLFQAVDVPSLRSLHDVVVFPRYGPRPHPDEMAGSDLDGDEYVVIWDKELMFDKNEAAFDYTSDNTEVVSENIKDFQNKMADFVVDSIKHDSLGQFANAFLAVSDFYGIESDVCNGIAKKHSQAVDFVKTGIKADFLRNRWIDDVPPERFERAPDFMEKEREPYYISPRLNGQLYRSIKQTSEYITNAMGNEEGSLFEVDQSLIDPNFLECIKEAEEHYIEYSNNIKLLMKRYGIQCEGELFSGSFCALRNTLSDRENDDMSFFNTTKMIEQQLLAIFATARERFFGDLLHQVTVEKRFPPTNPFKNTCQRVCKDPPIELKRLASAYYIFSYANKERKLLSFPWLAWDVLMVVSRENKMNNPSQQLASYDALGDKLSIHINNYVHNQKEAMESFCDNVITRLEALHRYAQRHGGLDHLMFFCAEWAQKNNIFDKNSFGKRHLCLLLIQFGLKYLKCDLINGNNQWLQLKSSDYVHSPVDIFDISQRTGGLGSLFVSFIKFLGSREFNKVPVLNFQNPDLGVQSFFRGREWASLHKAALNTYHQLVFSGSMDCLPCSSYRCSPSSLTEVVEAASFILEIPLSRLNTFENNAETARVLCAYTNCLGISFRHHPKCFQLVYPLEAEEKKLRDADPIIRLLVSSHGNRPALARLRSLLAMHPNINLTKCRKAGIQLLVMQVVEQVDRLLMNLLPY